MKSTAAYTAVGHGHQHHSQQQQQQQQHQQQHHHQQQQQQQQQYQAYDSPLTVSSTSITSTASTTATQMDAPYGLAITQPVSMRRLDSAAPHRTAAMSLQQQQQHLQQRKQAISGSPIRRNNNGTASTQQQQQQQHQQLQQQQQQYSGHSDSSGGAVGSGGSGGSGGGGGNGSSHSMQRYMPSTTEDTLEYFIKFPTPTYNNPQQQQLQLQQQQLQLQRMHNNDYDANESDYVFVYNESNVPIVLLLGWAGCQDRYLMKYSKIYEDRGLITVRYTAPVDTLFWKRTAMVPIGEKILKLMYDMNFDGHPIVLHIFSNGGAYLYQHISLAMRKHNTPLQIRGMIFDSAPGERRMLGLYRAVSAIYGKEKRKCNSITAIIITLTLSLMWFVEETFSAFKSLFVSCGTAMVAHQTNPFNDLKNEPNQFPQLFLYSKADVVIPHTDVEKFINIRQQQGVDVSSVCFEDAEHVKIYTKYPTHYIHTVCTFINNCLSLPYKGVAAIFPNASSNNSLGSSDVNCSKYD